MAVVGGTECADMCRALPTMIRETFTDQKVSVVVSTDKTLLRVCYDLCKTDLYIQILLHVIVRVRWAGHVARMGEERGCIGSCWGNRREVDHWGDLGVDGWIILGWLSRRWDVGI